MAYITDSTQTFTITLTAMLEGFGSLAYIEVSNFTQGTGEYWTPVGGWSGILQAVEADSIYVLVEVENTGATTDTLFAEFVSAQVTPAESSIQEILNVVVGFAGGVSWTFTMPPNDVSILINAGHVE